jgi:hypothetical protein
MGADSQPLLNNLKQLQQNLLIPTRWRSFGDWGNWFFDTIFYDVRRVPPQIWSKCRFDNVPENSVVVLERIPGHTPSEPSTFKFTIHPNSHKIHDEEIKKIAAVAIAGVGSSALGTVALAIDVADAIGGHVMVAGIVSGEGRHDAGEEGFGGWYWLRPENIAQQWMGNLSRLLQVSLDRTLGIPTSLTNKYFNSAIDAMPGAGMSNPKLLESDSLLNFLESAENLQLVVAHSKGALYLADALSKLAKKWHESEQKSDAKSKQDTHGSMSEHIKHIDFVTLGAVIYPPREFCGQVHQFIGELDAFGALNSRLLVEKTIIPGVGHHLNTAVPMHMDCSKVLQSHIPQLARMRIVQD